MADNSQSGKLLLSVRDVVALTGMHKETVKRLARAGDMPGAVKFTDNGPWFFRRHELMAHIAGDDDAAVSETRAQVG
jgi:predicted DNA-binding transcriptional regulator AlpA